MFTNIAGPALLLFSVSAYAAAPSLIPAALGPQWLDSVPLMQIFVAVVVTGFLTPLNMDLAKIYGFAHAYTYYAVLRSVGTVGVLLLASQYSVLMVVIAWVIVGFASNLINDAIFYMKQDFVPLTGGKIVITGASWAWGAFVIVNALR
jgi:hypothetical protein